MTDSTAQHADGSVRVDKWLWAARCFKTRSKAKAACDAGVVQINGETAKASAKVKVGDMVQAVCPGKRLRILEVAALAEKRGSASVAAELFVDYSPAPAPKVDPAEGGHVVHRGEGRPTKRERRRFNTYFGRS